MDSLTSNWHTNWGQVTAQDLPIDDATAMIEDADGEHFLASLRQFVEPAAARPPVRLLTLSAIFDAKALFRLRRLWLRGVRIPPVCPRVRLYAALALLQLCRSLYRAPRQAGCQRAVTPPLCVSGHLMKSFPDFPDRLSTVSEETTPGGLLAGLGLLSLLLVFMVWIPQRTLISTVPPPDYKRFLQSVQMEECLVKTCVIQIHRDGCLASEQVQNILEREKLPFQTVNCSKSQECERFLLRTLGRGYWGYGWPVSNPTPTFLVGRKVLRGSAHLPEVMKFLSTR
ncbi:MAG: hypothetical protein ACK5RP_06210 [Betaproteobacteria bacterium]